MKIAYGVEFLLQNMELLIEEGRVKDLVKCQSGGETLGAFVEMEGWVEEEKICVGKGVGGKILWWWWGSRKLIGEFGIQMKQVCSV